MKCFGKLWIICRCLLCCFGSTPHHPLLLPRDEFNREGKAQQSILDKAKLKEGKDRGRNENGQVERCIFLPYHG